MRNKAMRYVKIMLKRNNHLFISKMNRTFAMWF